MSVKIKVDDGKIVIDINNFYQFYVLCRRSAKFGIASPLPNSLKQADLVALATERRNLMPKGDLEWGSIDKINFAPDTFS